MTYAPIHHDDLTNLTLALEMRRRYPQIQVTLRLHDLQLAERARQDLNVRAVLNAASLSAPAFVAAALGEEILGAFQIDGVNLNLITLKATENTGLVGATLRELAARLDVNPLAVRTGDGNHALAHSLDRTIASGEEVIVATSQTTRNVRMPGSTGSHRRAPDRSSRGAHRQSGKRSLAAGLLRPARILVRVSPQIQAIRLAMIALATLGALVFHFSSMRLGWLDALYFTVSIMSTVGFGDIHLLEQSSWLKLFGCMLMFSGPALFMAYFSLITDHLVCRRFVETLRKPRRRLSDHIVVVGLGNVGYHVVARLHKLGERVVVVERDRESDFVAMLPDEVPVIFGDVRQSQRMHEAGIERARTVMALTDADLVNLRIAQQAKVVNPRIKTVVRLFDPSLANRLDSSLFGVDVALSPAQIAAATCAAATLASDVLHGFALDGRLKLLRRQDAGPRAEWVGRTLGELRENLGLIALVRKSAAEDAPRAAGLEDVIQSGDRLIVLEERSSAAPTMMLSSSVDSPGSGSAVAGCLARPRRRRAYLARGTQTPLRSR